MQTPARALETVASNGMFAVARFGRVYRVCALDHASGEYAPIEQYPATDLESALWDYEGYLRDADV
jgi:hypothetical protein